MNNVSIPAPSSNVFHFVGRLPGAMRPIAPSYAGCRGSAISFLALRYAQPPAAGTGEKAEQYQLFETTDYLYRVFVTNLRDPIWWAIWFYNRRAGAENLIKEANNDAGLTAHP